MDKDLIIKGLGALAGAAAIAGGLALTLGANDPMADVALDKKQAMVVDKAARAAVEADVATAVTSDQDARVAYEAADAAVNDDAAPAVGTKAHDTLLAARFAARVAWAAAGVAANNAAKAVQNGEEARKVAEADFDRAVCDATKTPSATVAAYCAKIAAPAALVEGALPAAEVLAP